MLPPKSWKGLLRKLKAIRMNKLVTKAVEDRRKELKKALCMPMSYGYHVGVDESGCGMEDFVVTQCKQVDGSQLWLFGVFDGQTGESISRDLHSNLYYDSSKESKIWKKAKEIITNAYLSTNAKVYEAQEQDRGVGGSTALIVMNGEKLVMANLGNYRAVVCRNGMPTQTSKQCTSIHRRLQSWTSIAGRLPANKIRSLTRPSGAAYHSTSISSKATVRVDKVDSHTEFVILASHGVWQVMKDQEAINLIKHIDDPQEASECLAKEALARMSKGNISCLIVRFA